jgi:hypothetical protein
MAFLRSLSDRMARPVIPDDQDFEYLPTQAATDFLASNTTVPLDGIVFPSVQVDGKGRNVILFHKASRVEEAMDDAFSVIAAAAIATGWPRNCRPALSSWPTTTCLRW